MSQPTCSVEGCWGAIKHRGWCEAHYARWYTTGDVRAEEPIRATRATFLHWLADLASERYGATGCRDWPFSKEKGGYPRKIKGRTGDKIHVAHLLMAMVGQPQPSNDLQICHACDRPPCLAPWHLRWGTQTENMAEAGARGLLSIYSENGKNSILTWEIVETIRSEHVPYKKGSAVMLAKRYGVSKRLIWDVYAGRRWHSQ